MAALIDDEEDGDGEENGDNVATEGAVDEIGDENGEADKPEPGEMAETMRPPSRGMMGTRLNRLRKQPT